MSEISYKVNQLAINNIEIINKPEDPRIFGFSSPISSMYFRDNREIYQKFNSGNTDWELIYPKETKNITANYTILRTNSNFTIDSTLGNIVLDLPDVSTLYKGKEFYFKKTSASNIITINSFLGQTIDGSSSKTLTTLNDSVVLIYIDSNNWTTKYKSTAISGSSSSTTVNQTSHGFSLCQVVKFNGTSYELAQADTVSNIGIWLITEIIDVNNFKIASSGYFDNLIGGTPDTTDYLSDIVLGGLTSTSPSIISQPIIYWITSTSGWILGYQANIISMASISNEYIISNGGVLNFTSLSGIYKLIEKNNVLNEIDIKYSINNTYVDLVVKNSSIMFTNTKDTALKTNIYVESLNVKIQNLTGSIKTFIIEKII